MNWFTQHRHSILLGFICFMAATVLVLGKKIFWPSQKPVAAFVTPPPANGMPKAPDSAVTLTIPLKTYSKKTAVKKMKLPAAIAENPHKEVTATADLKPTPGGYTVASVIDTTTGVSDIISREKPRPLFGFGGESEIGLLGGITNHGDSALVFVRQDLLRVGSVHLFGAGGTGVMGGSFGVGAFIGASMKW